MTAQVEQSLSSRPQLAHKQLANAIRALAIDSVEKAKSGHPGLPLGTADVAAVLFSRFLKFDAANPAWPDRDRFILSAGHGSTLLYALLYLTGSSTVTLDELKRFRQLHSKTPGHPENFVTPGIETTTGPLGQGLAMAVGFALAERLLNAEFGQDLIDHFTYVLASDGDLMEGISQEAIALAGHLKLNRLIVIWDDNGISIDGPLSLSDSVDQVKRFEAAGWSAVHVDGHDPEAIAAAIEAAQKSDRPTLIAAKTVIGYGSPKKAGTSKAHGEPLGADELVATKEALGWPHGPFEIPADILSAWREIGARGKAAREAWQSRLAARPEAERTEFARRINNETDARRLHAAIDALKTRLAAEKPTIATRKASELALEALVNEVPELLLGSADLTPSNNTRTKDLKSIAPGDYTGRYIHYGIREHAMAAAMNGILQHGGYRPAGGTFLVFSDYARPAIRLAALTGTPAIYVFTHDSIGLGEDGPTHQPVEHLAALRAIPNLRVLRPADAVETAEAWQIALGRTTGPTLLALTRQNLPTVRSEPGPQNLSATGAYELSPAEGVAVATLFASGSEVEIALAAQKLLQDKGIGARVVSVPSLELFLDQPEDVRKAVIGNAPVKVAIEAAVRFGWDGVIGPDGIFVGLSGFGASGPYKDLYAHFGITPEAVAEKVLARSHA
ncbi:transketolase [Pseudochelatococcus contaminans]|uniref:Transketolase n=1 Tax=Pseudochelatococcus contaminans TaxID=1538103 RepID=A0A7W5Z2S8_9HYPH|nr:transketolase [Pseudochelatococcus contaminans]